MLLMHALTVRLMVHGHFIQRFPAFTTRRQCAVLQTRCFDELLSSATSGMHLTQPATSTLKNHCQRVFKFDPRAMLYLLALCDIEC